MSTGQRENWLLCCSFSSWVALTRASAVLAVEQALCPCQPGINCIAVPAVHGSILFWCYLVAVPLRPAMRLDEADERPSTEMAGHVLSHLS